MEVDFVHFDKFSLSRKALYVGMSLCFSVCSLSAYGSAFQLFEYSAAAVGNYNAGGAAEANDASIAATNPAGLVRMTHPTMSASATGIWTSADFNGSACGGSLCVPTRASDNGGGYATVPAFQAAAPISDRLFVGLSITAPFGLKTQWSDSTPLAYSATKSEIETIDVSPTLGVKITDKFSVGAGLDLQRFRATLSSEVNLNPATLNDTLVKNTAEDWAYGWNAGGLYQFSDNSRVGLSFHSQVVHHPDGTSDARNPSLATMTGKAKTNIVLPAYTMLSGYHAFNNHWSVMGTVIYTDWEQIRQIALKNVVVPTGVGLTTTTGTVVLPQNFDSTWRISAGVDYRINEHWKLRAGGGYDETPTNDADRTIRLPDGNRYVAAVGAQYRYNEVVSLDAGYEHVFQKDGDINQQETLSKSIGTVESYANLFGLQLNITMV